MNFQSGKFITLKRIKLFALSRAGTDKRKMCGATNLPCRELSTLKIHRVSALKIFSAIRRKIRLCGGQAGNLPRAEFSTLKIETVENGSIRQ